MPIFHKIRFKHIFHKRESLYMLPKEKCICMLKRKFCVASFWFLTIVICLFSCFSPLHQHWKHLYLQKFPFFFLKIRVKSSFSPSCFWKERMPAVYNSTVIFLPDVSDLWRWPNPVKPLNVTFLLQNRSGTKEWIVINHVYN